MFRGAWRPGWPTRRRSPRQESRNNPGLSGTAFTSHLSCGCLHGVRQHVRLMYAHSSAHTQEVRRGHICINDNTNAPERQIDNQMVRIIWYSYYIGCWGRLGLFSGIGLAIPSTLRGRHNAHKKNLHGQCGQWSWWCTSRYRHARHGIYKMTTNVGSKIDHRL